MRKKRTIDSLAVPSFCQKKIFLSALLCFLMVHSCFPLFCFQVLSPILVS